MRGERMKPPGGAVKATECGRRAANPWREVVHTELQTNGHGRDCWWLTLECGHHKYASIPGVTMIPELVRMRGPPAAQPQGAAALPVPLVRGAGRRGRSHAPGGAGRTLVRRRRQPALGGA